MARPKGSRNKRTVFLNQLFDESNLDWRKDIVRMLKRMPEALRFKYYLELLPYLAAKVEPKEWTPTSPEESVQRVNAVEKAFQEAKQAAQDKARKAITPQPAQSPVQPIDPTESNPGA